MPTFYSLLVAVNHYQNDKISHLNGCVQDAEAFAECLQLYRDTGNYQLKTVKLYSQHGENNTALPTRDNILLALQQHINLLQKGDIFCFFYAGHGSSEKAHPYFESPTGTISTLVPCNSGQMENGKQVFDILSVEIRQVFSLMYQKSQAEIIFIQDSCHSEGASRAYGNWAEAGLFQKREIELSKHPNFGKTREAGQFFIEQADAKEALSRQTGASNPPNQVPFHKAVPEAPHIHLAACSFDECAYETRETGQPRGIFTTELTRLLRLTNGKISYHELEKRLRMGMAKGFPQNPNLYIKSLDKNSRFRQFLNQNTLLKNRIYQLIPQPQGQNQGIIWRVDVGALQGLPVLRGEESLALQIYPQDGEKIPAKIDYVAPNHSELSAASAQLLAGQNQGQLWYAEIEEKAFIDPRLRVKIHQLPAGKNMALEAGIKELIANSPEDFCLSDSDSSQYQLTQQQNWIFLHKNEPNSTPKLLLQSAIINQNGQPAPARRLANQKWEIDDNGWAVLRAENGLVFAPISAENWDLWVFGIADWLLENEKNLPISLSVVESAHFSQFESSPLCQFAQPYLIQTEEAGAELLISSDLGQFQLLHKDKKAAAAPTVAADLAAAVEICEQIKTIAVYKQRKFLQNPHPNRIQSFAGVELACTITDLYNGSKYELLIKQDAAFYHPIRLSKQKNSSGLQQNTLFSVSVRYSNGLFAEQKIYLALLLLGTDYSISPLIDLKTVMPAQQISSNQQQFACFDTANIAQFPNFSDRAALKLLVSFSPFDLSGWLQDGIAMPNQPKTSAEALRSVRQKGESAADWNAFTIPLEV